MFGHETTLLSSSILRVQVPVQVYRGAKEERFSWCKLSGLKESNRLPKITRGFIGAFDNLLEHLIILVPQRGHVS